MTDDTVTLTPPEEPPAPKDLISQISRSPESEARMRDVWGHVGPTIWQLLYIARNERAQKLATIGNKGSLAARRCMQFIYAVDMALGIDAPPNGTE